MFSVRYELDSKEDLEVSVTSTKGRRLGSGGDWKRRPRKGVGQLLVKNPVDLGVAGPSTTSTSNLDLDKVFKREA